MTFLNVTVLAKPQLRGACRALHACWVFSLLATASWTAQAMQAIEQWQQPNGVQIYLVRSPYIPMLDVRIDVDAGARREPAESG